MGKQQEELGFIDHGTGKHQSNTVFNRKKICPTVTTIQGGTQQIKVVRIWKGSGFKKEYREFMKKYVKEHLDEIGLKDGEDAMD